MPPSPSETNDRSHKFGGKYLTIFLVVLLLAVPIATATAANAQDPSDLEAVDDFSVWLDGPVQAAPGALLTYNITSDAAGLFGAELDIGFDPAVLQVVGTQVTPGACPQPDFVVTNSVDNALGTISYAATSLAPTLPCAGGIIASFQFQVSAAAAAGSTSVQFDKVILADSNGTQIPAAPTNLDLSIVVATITAQFSGSPTAGTSPLTVNFSNLSSGAYDTCTWDFGDSSGSGSCVDLSHTYTTLGTYTVSLTVTGASGSDNETKLDYIYVFDQHLLYLPVILR